MSNRQSKWQSRWLAVPSFSCSPPGQDLGWRCRGHGRCCGRCWACTWCWWGRGWPLRRRCCPQSSWVRQSTCWRPCVASIALAVMGGLVLDATPWGLQPISWSVAAGRRDGGGLAGGAAAAARERMRSRAAAGMRNAWRCIRRCPRLGWRCRLWRSRCLALAVYVARMPAPADRFQGYTTLWAGAERPAGRQRTGARIGVQSGEFAATSYRLEVRVNGQVADVWPDLTLEPNQAWQAQLALPDAGTGRHWRSRRCCTAATRRGSSTGR